MTQYGYEQASEAAEFLKERMPFVPKKAIILGSGLSSLADEFTDKVEIPYAEIPHFPPPAVVGHRGVLVCGRLNGVETIGLAGRFHFYEGYPLDLVVLPARVLALLGVEKLIITNAAGGVNRDFAAGDLMLISDHINMTGQNPLDGHNDERFGTRFPDMSQVYSREMGKKAQEAAKSVGVKLQKGVYMWNRGPSYETPAEVRMARTLGADAVGMSTVPEAIAAVHAGIKVLGFSLITNLAAGILDQPLTHTEVTETAKQSEKSFVALISEVVKII